MVHVILFTDPVIEIGPIKPRKIETEEGSCWC